MTKLSQGSTSGTMSFGTGKRFWYGNTFTELGRPFKTYGIRDSSPKRKPQTKEQNARPKDHVRGKRKISTAGVTILDRKEKETHLRKGRGTQIPTVHTLNRVRLSKHLLYPGPGD